MNQASSNDSLAQAYNNSPYTSKVFATCQPTRLHAIAKIKGLNPPDLATARVLEIGCSFGGNLLSFAIRHPSSQVVGVDLSDHQIAVGQQILDQIGVDNVTLLQGDISQMTFEQPFDYIICHGVFSWVPDFVQEAILKTIQTQLSDNGIAYISYNVYPGWKIKDIAKDLMHFGANPALTSGQRLEQSYAMLDFVAGKMSNKQLSHQAIVECFQKIKNQDNHYVLHEYLEDINKPIYFHEFVQQIQAFDLTYLAESTIPAVLSSLHFSSNDEKQMIYNYFERKLEKIEQYADFVHNQTFRSSIITHRANLDKTHQDFNIDVHSLCHNFYDVYLKLFATYEPKSDDQDAHWQILGQNITLPSNPINDTIFEFVLQCDGPVRTLDILNHLTQTLGDQSDDYLSVLWTLIHLPCTYLCFEPHPLQAYKTKPKLNDKYRKLIAYTKENPNTIQYANHYDQNIHPTYLLQYLSQFLDGSKTIKALVKQVRNDLKQGNLSISIDDVEQSCDDLSDDALKDIVVQTLDLLQAYGLFNQYP